MILAFIRRAWLNYEARSLSVRAAAARDELDYLESCYRDEPYNQDLHYAILHERAFLRAAEEQQAVIRDQLVS